jgi:hypothetical protein
MPIERLDELPTLRGPATFGIHRTNALLALLVSHDRALRVIQSLNTERGIAFESQTIASTAAQQLTRVQAQRDKPWSGVYITCPATSGEGKYRIDGPAAGIASGQDIPAGFFELWIAGVDNLRNLSLIATGATALVINYTLFD